MTCRTEYENRLQTRRQARDDLRRRDDQAVNFRTAMFCFGVLVAWVVVGGWQVPWQFLLAPIGMFVAAVVYHESIKRNLSAAERAIEFYERALNRLDGDWTGIGPTGEEFLDPRHPYAGDLDIFGVGSLFQLLNSPVTPAGAKTLAAWLTPDISIGPPEEATVIQRQEAIRSLRNQLDLRERLAVIGPTQQSQLDAAQLRRWLANPGGLTAIWVRAAACLLGILGIAFLAVWLITDSKSAFILTLLAQFAFVYRLRESLEAIKNYSQRAVVELRRIENVLSALESVTAEADEIRRLRQTLVGDGPTASKSIHRLERLTSQFENMRRNLFIAPLAFLSMISLQFAVAIDRWRATQGPKVERWFQAVGELEALLAFSQLHFENANYCFPRLLPASTDDAPQFSATQLAHPLLPSSTAVANTIELSGRCRLLLVSGSNMSGKSTLLRSVGVNTVLAWAGAPTCAQSLSLSRLQIAAAMRMQDSLQTGTSHFFAELQRIQLVVELAQKKVGENQTPILFLLDEILHGTNSHDRLVGARGVIQSLLEAGALGLVTTHDLALSEMVTELDAPARNVHFRDEWIDGKMTFDYQMRDGVVPKSNALSLMRLLGLHV